MTYNPRGAGINKAANFSAITALLNPQDGDYAVALDTGITYQYKSSISSWITAMNTFTNPSSTGNWSLVNRLPCTAGTVPTSTFNISGCTKFRVEIEVTTTPSAALSLTFDSDAGSNYQWNDINSTGTAVTATNATNTNGFLKVPTTAASMLFVCEFNKTTKFGRVHSYIKGGTSATQATDIINTSYIGAGAMNTITYSGTGSFTGYISVYQWVDVGVPLSLYSYELINELTPSASVVDTTIQWDGEVDDMAHIVCEMASGTPTNIFVALNGDTTGANYTYTTLVGNGTTASSSTGNNVGMYIGYTDGRAVISDVFLKVSSGPRKTTAIGGTNITSTVWSDTTTPVTSLKVYSNGNAVTGRIRIYRLVKSQLATTNPNVCSTFIKYIDANTVEVQPGEVEINGAVCRISKATQVTLSGNIQAGQSEATNTMFYLYAVRGSTGNTPTYMFSTTAPLMDRYGNSVANFTLCDMNKAWFHPTLGFMYRYIGNVYNDASNNITSFVKQYLSPPLIGSMPVATATGSVNVITAQYTQNIGFVDQTIVAFEATGANTSTVPTLNVNGLGAKNITKRGGQSLIAGDIPGTNAVCIVLYSINTDSWELLNPAIPLNLLISTNVNALTKQMYQSPVAISSSGGTLAIDCDQHAFCTTTLTEITTLGNPSNMASGKVVEIVITGTSGFTLAFASAWKATYSAGYPASPANGKRLWITAETDGISMFIRSVNYEL